ncbi:MAG: hypothetical protein ACPGVB_01020 [Chitinophagales bacterium]
MNTKDRIFKNWTVDNVRFELGVIEKKKCELLDDWLDVNQNIEGWEAPIIDRLLKKATQLIDTWNEYELQTKFIAPITELVDFDSLEYYFSAFSERKLEATYIHKNVQMPLKGKVDWMVATYLLNQTPPTPTLFDPFPKKDKDMPLYGCYVVGRWWFFVVLHKKSYCVSSSYDSMNKKKLHEIIAILKKQKQLIINKLTTS